MPAIVITALLDVGAEPSTPYLRAVYRVIREEVADGGGKTKDMFATGGKHALVQQRLALAFR